MKKLFILLTMLTIAFSCSSKSEKGNTSTDDAAMVAASFDAIQSQDTIEGLADDWGINNLIGIEYLYDSVPAKVELYNLVNIRFIQKKTQRKYFYGNLATFNSDGTFTCFYTAPCGNDCFPASFGRYKAIDDSHIVLQLDSISQSGFCEKISKKVDINLGIYHVVSTDSTFILKWVDRL